MISPLPHTFSKPTWVIALQVSLVGRQVRLRCNHVFSCCQPSFTFHVPRSLLVMGPLVDGGITREAHWCRITMQSCTNHMVRTCIVSLHVKWRTRAKGRYCCWRKGDVERVQIMKMTKLIIVFVSHFHLISSDHQIMCKPVCKLRRLVQSSRRMSWQGTFWIQNSPDSTIKSLPRLYL